MNLINVYDARLDVSKVINNIKMFIFGGSFILGIMFVVYKVSKWRKLWGTKPNIMVVS